MEINTKPDTNAQSVSQILNQSFDKANQLLVLEALGFDGQGFKRSNAEDLALKITTSGTATYIGQAAVGTAQSTAKWQCFKYDSGVLTYADSDSEYDNVATDLTALTYG